MVWFNFAAGGGGGGGCLKSYASGARCAAALKAFLLDWNTFSQTFSCFSMTSGLNCLPQPLEHSTSSMLPGSYSYDAIFFAGFTYFGLPPFASFAIYRSSKAKKSWLALMGASSIWLTKSLLGGCLLMGRYSTMGDLVGTGGDFYAAKFLLDTGGVFFTSSRGGCF